MTSAGLLMYRFRGENLEIFLVHPGGPYFRNKDNGAWDIPKGKVEDGEDLREAARREFVEETGLPLSGKETFFSLDSIKMKSGKRVWAWAFRITPEIVRRLSALESPSGALALTSKTFEMEWPPRSGKKQTFPENDAFGFFSSENAKQKIYEPQIPFIERLEKYLKTEPLSPRVLPARSDHPRSA